MDLLDGEGWTVIQRRIDGAMDFNRTWSEYRNGFGSFNKNFWLGLHKIKRITDMGTYSLYIGMEDFDGYTQSARYGTFMLGSKESQYKLFISGYEGSESGMGSLMPHNMKPFSTKDKDATTVGCAKHYSSGWWFENNNFCLTSNLNGVWYPSGIHSDGIKWTGWYGQIVLKTTVMAVKRLSPEMS